MGRPAGDLEGKEPLTLLAMTEPEFQTLLARYLAGRATPEEAQLVERLYEQLGGAAHPKMSPPEQEKLLEAMWQRLESRTQSPALQPQRPLAAFWRTPALRWAAAALLALGAGAGLLAPAWRPQTSRPSVRDTAVAAAAVSAWTEHRNTTQQKQAITLPDGSRVLLNPGSSLRYAAGLVGPRREVYFSGDAFFKVSKNPARPFLVLTKQVVTTVLGTSFRVRAMVGSPTATVAVREGRVAVQAREGAHLDLDATPNRPAAAGVLLLANQQAVYSAAAPQPLRKELAPTPAVLAPQSFVFDARPVPEVLAALSTAYGVEIEYDRAALAGCTVTLDLTNKSLAAKLGVLCEALGASYEEADARILFHCQGCKSK